MLQKKQKTKGAEITLGKHILIVLMHVTMLLPNDKLRRVALFMS